MMTSDEPRSGVLYQKKEKVKAAEQQQQQQQTAPQPAQTNLGDAIRQREAGFNPAVLNFGDKGKGAGKTLVTEDGVTLIKAKDENYAFKDVDDSAIRDDKDMHNWVVDADGKLVRKKLTAKEEQDLLESKKKLYRCTSLKLNNNDMSSFDRMDRAFYLTLFRPMVNLTMVDLSCNKIASIPNGFFEQYPLHTLLLHGNLISSIDDVKRLSCLAGTLRVLSLYDNPIQRANNRKYRMMIMCALPFLSVLDDVFITAADRDKLGVFVEMFVPKKERSVVLSTIGGRLPPINGRNN